MSKEELEGKLLCRFKFYGIPCALVANENLKNKSGSFSVYGGTGVLEISPILQEDAKYETIWHELLEMSFHLSGGMYEETCSTGDRMFVFNHKTFSVASATAWCAYESIRRKLKRKTK